MERQSIYDVIVVGAGTMGMAAGYFLAKQKAKTLLVDAFDPPHSNSSHHGNTRMIRHAYGEGRAYVTLVKRAQELWEQLEEESTYKIFEKTGVLGIGAVDSPFLNETLASAAKFSLPLQKLSADEVMKRWPGLKLPQHFMGCFEPESGFLYSENCIQAYRELAIKNGADVLINTPVVNVEAKNGHVMVQTEQETFSARKVILSTGAWTGKLLPSLQLPIQPLRKVFGWFETESTYDLTHFPSFYIDEGHRMFYGFPNVKGEGLKLGRTDGGQPIDPSQHVQDFGSYWEDEGELRECLQAYLPGANGSLRQGKTCLQTWSSDSHFIIDYHPEHRNILIAGGFSGHGFKFGSVIGEILCQMALEGKRDDALSLFALSRFN
ncbi:N-methyl-L-tryptophan oxidase [Pullulanibacillus sp. KACC 23026]|uniref:N-methyl-L-tryptophan oxidase n=1 Tax=Pullulanibacillus sp. KACC 23026 TaxID=3028315 RepID=UPI0023AF69D4|nr:N-methyl-L-tryptophan oxidase [Pullulanibacillus sp. KACC 23026]WEG12198.1 N-methyl-L-tryptophan oxidase [Pullulanibacillus sp. KACC 23026]